MSHERYLHILLVEDYRHSAEAMASLLRHQGHYVTVTGSVASAQAAVRDARDHAFPVDLAIVDLNLPDGSGWELLRQLGAQGIRGISISGAITPLAAREGTASRIQGFLAHLPKPIDPAALERVVRDTAAAAA